jgi:anti-sigma factor RsiW
MSTVVPMEHDEHATVLALLPWYARGQLGGAELQAVESHLLHCHACREELAAERPMQSLLNLAGALPESGDVEMGLARMREQIGAQRREAKRATPSRWMPWALGLQGAAIALLVALWLQSREAQPGYQGLSAAGSAPVVADALVMFKPGTTEQAVRELLQAEHAGIVAGPTEAGAWLLRVDPHGLAALRAAPIVAMAEPLQPGPGQ